MANNEFTIPIPARLKNVAKGGHVAGAKDIIDDALGKEQSEINQEVIEAIEGNTEAVAAERQRAVAAEGALDTRLSDVEELAEISIDGGEAKIATGEDFHNPTTEQRAKVTTVGAILDGADDKPTAGSDNLVKSGGIKAGFDNILLKIAKKDNYILYCNNHNLIAQELFNVQNNNKYRLITDTTWNISNLSNGEFYFGLYAKQNGQTTKRTIVDIRKGDSQVVNPYYDFELTGNEDYVWVECRGNAGEQVNVSLLDITDIPDGNALNIDTINNSLLELSTHQDFYFPGNGGTVQSKYSLVLNKGTYKVVFDYNSWSISNISSASSVFWVNINNTEVYDLRQNVAISSQIAAYQFIIGNDNTSVDFNIRANTGTQNHFSLISFNTSDRLSDYGKSFQNIYANGLTKGDSLMFFGNDSTDVVKSLPIYKGHTYRITPVTKSWSIENLSFNSSYIWAYININNNTTTLFELKKRSGSVDTISDFYLYTAENDGTIEITIRGDYGEAINIAFEDIGVDAYKDFPYIYKSASCKRITCYGQNGGDELKYIPIVGGNTYIIVPKSSNWPVTLLNSTDSVFWLESSSSTYANVKKGNGSWSLSPYYTIQQALDDLLEIGFRADADVSINFDIYEIGKDQIQENADWNFEQDKRLDFIEGGDILSIYPQKEIEPILASLKYIDVWRRISSNRYKFSLLWFSDLHSTKNTLQRYIKFYNTYKKYFNAIVSTGDQVDRDTDDFSFWADSGAQKVLDVIGNHETLRDAGVDTLYVDKEGTQVAIKVSDNMLSQKYCYKKYFEPFLTDTDIVIQENHTYWYKDFASPYNVRLIAVDWEHWREKVELVDNTEWDYYAINEFPNQTTSESVDTGQQHQWFVNTLNEARTLGYSVIVLEHEPHRYTNPPLQCTYTSLDFTYSAVGIIEGAQDVQNFIDAGGDFVVWLSGEIHRSAFGVLESYPDQTQCTLETSRLKYNDGDTQHILNTESQDCLEVVSVDKEKKRLSLYRIGSSRDRYGRHIGALVWDYAKYPVFDSTQSYAVGDKVRNGNKWYKFIQAHSANTSWNDAEVEVYNKLIYND